jgi:hypothetical protein
VPDLNGDRGLLRRQSKAAGGQGRHGVSGRKSAAERAARIRQRHAANVADVCRD